MTKLSRKVILGQTIPMASITGWYDPTQRGGALRLAANSYLPGARDPGVKLRDLRRGDLVVLENGRVCSVNGQPPETVASRPEFARLGAVHPSRLVRLETPEHGGGDRLRCVCRGDELRFWGVVEGSFHLVCPARGGTFYPLGTDRLGRDVLSRIVYVTRISLTVGWLVIAISCLIGVTLGGISGYYGGWIDKISIRLVDVFQALPGLVVLITVLGIFGSGLWQLIVVIGVLMGPPGSRVIRSQVLSVMSSPFIDAARVGGGDHRVRRRVALQTAQIVHEYGLGLALVEGLQQRLGQRVREGGTCAWRRRVRAGHPVRQLIWPPVAGLGEGEPLPLTEISLGEILLDHQRHPRHVRHQDGRVKHGLTRGRDRPDEGHAQVLVALTPVFFNSARNDVDAIVHSEPHT